MPLPKLVISRILFDPAAIATALKIDEEHVVKAFQDGRGAWPFSEHWGALLYEYVKHGNSNKPLSDGAVALEQLRDVNVSVKALTKAGIKFQQSKDVGSRRPGTKAGLIAAIEACDRIVAVDVADFPNVRFIPIDATRLVGAAYQDKLKIGGWSKSRFYRWLGETYDVCEITLNV